MSERASVLYDIPGPKAKRFNLILSVIFAALLLAAGLVRASPRWRPRTS